MMSDAEDDEMSLSHWQPGALKQCSVATSCVTRALLSAAAASNHSPGSEGHRLSSSPRLVASFIRSNASILKPLVHFSVQTNYIFHGFAALGNQSST